MPDGLVCCSLSWTLLLSLCDEMSAVCSAVPPLCLKFKDGVEIVALMPVCLSCVSDVARQEVSSVSVIQRLFYLSQSQHRMYSKMSSKDSKKTTKTK